MKSFRIIGLMSGTSLDGVDVADVLFTKDQNLWSFDVLNTHTIEYPDELRCRLNSATCLNSQELGVLSKDLGLFFGEVVNQFIEDHLIDKKLITAVSSHGQTIFHQPEKSFTLQIGNGPEGAVRSGLKWVCDFRTKDIALGGQGAPLVPIGDYMLLQNKAEGFLNLGGFANISYKENNKIHAYDICPVNLVFNLFAHKLANKSYDEKGGLGRLGKVDKVLVKKWDELTFYQDQPPKSLGIEWLDAHFYPLLEDLFSEDQCASAYHHIAGQIASVLTKANLQSVLITGGGAKNDYLIELIKSRYNGKIILPELRMIDFKEAIIFAFLAALRLNGENNILKTYTGATRDSSAGVIHFP